MRLKEKLCNYLTLKTHKSVAFSLQWREATLLHSFLFSRRRVCLSLSRSRFPSLLLFRYFFFVKIFSLNGLLCFVLLSFTKFITVFFFRFHPLLFGLVRLMLLEWGEESTKKRFLYLWIVEQVFTPRACRHTLTLTHTSHLQTLKKAQNSLFFFSLCLFQNNFIKQNK